MPLIGPNVRATRGDLSDAEDDFSADTGRFSLSPVASSVALGRSSSNDTVTSRCAFEGAGSEVAVNSHNNAERASYNLGGSPHQSVS
jgi:hypothetical protein